MSKQPLISVIITCYNYGEYVQQAIESVFSQTYKNLELIVINDGSTDDSDSIIKETIKKAPDNVKVSYIKQKNQGIVSVRNKGIHLPEGKYLCFLDADDFWDKDYLEKLYTKISSDKLDVVYTDLRCFGDRNNLIVFPEFSLGEIISHNIVSMGSLIRSDAIGNQRFDEEMSHMSHEDWDFFLGLALAGKKFVKSNDTQLNYRIHQNHRNINHDFARNLLNFQRVYDYVYGKYRKMFPEVDIEYNAKNDILFQAVDVKNAYDALSNQNQELMKNNKDLCKQNQKLRVQNQSLDKQNQELNTSIKDMQNFWIYRLMNTASKIIRSSKRGKIDG